MSLHGCRVRPIEYHESKELQNLPPLRPWVACVKEDILRQDDPGERACDGGAHFARCRRDLAKEVNSLSLIKELMHATTLTEREADIRDFVLNHPERLTGMSSQALGKATYTSAATVTRFCQKFGCKGYPDFKLKFLSDLMSGQSLTAREELRLDGKKNIASLLQLVTDMQVQALEATRSALSYPQLGRVQQLLLDHQYIDFYAYDVNLHIARYASSMFFHAGKTAVTYSETNVQVLSTLSSQPGHLAILISHTGENGRLIELARILRGRNVPQIVLTTSKNTTLAPLANECLLAFYARGTDRMWANSFFTSCKYLLDIMYAIMFVERYDENMVLNRDYEAIGEVSFWSLAVPVAQEKDVPW